MAVGHANIIAACERTNGAVRAVQQHASHSNLETTIRHDDIGVNSSPQPLKPRRSIVSLLIDCGMPHASARNRGIFMSIRNMLAAKNVASTAPSYILLESGTMKIAEFAKRARTARLAKKAKLQEAFDRACRDLRLPEERNASSLSLAKIAR